MSQRSLLHCIDSIVYTKDSSNSLSAMSSDSEMGDSEPSPKRARVTNIRTGRETDSTSSIELDAYGMPKAFRHHRVHNVKSSSWKFYHILTPPILKSKINKMGLMMTAGDESCASTTKEKECTHLCLLCLEDLKKKIGKSRDAWVTAAYRITNSANASNHLKKMHGDHPDIKDAVKKDATSFDKKVSASASSISVMSGGLISANRAYFEQRSEKHNQLIMAQWLIYDNKPYHTVTSKYFRAMFETRPGRTFTPMSPKTFQQFLDREFDCFTEKVTNLLLKAKEELPGHRFVQVIHDMWTSAGTDNILGSCLSFVDSNFKRHIIPAFLLLNNKTHAGEWNATLLKEKYLERFQIGIDDLARYVTSDTTSAARAVSNHIEGTEQVDCEMHILNLILLYGIGLRDNFKTERSVGEDGIERRVRSAVTQGGIFPDGARVIKVLRDICKYFGSPQKLDALKRLQDANHLPSGIPLLDGKTRVASCHKLLQSSILHHWSLKHYSQSIGHTPNDEFHRLWKSLQDVDWRLIREMEAIMKDLARYAMGGSQSDGALPSDILVYRMVAMKVIARETFLLLPLGHHNKGCTLSDLERLRGGGGGQVVVDDLSTPGKVCLSRFKHQIQVRFTDKEEAKTYLPLYLDPRTVPFADRVIPMDFREEVLELFSKRIADILLVNNTTKLSNDEEPQTPHPETLGWDVDEDINIPEPQSPDVPNRVATDDFDLILSQSDADGDMTSPVTDYARNLLNAKTSVHSWIDYCRKSIEWDKFLKLKKARDDAVGCVPAQDTQNQRYSNLLNRLEDCDPMLWFEEVGKKLFPSIATLVRIEFAKVDSSAIQERMFSAAAAVMITRQTQMSHKVHERRTVLFANKDFMR